MRQASTNSFSGNTFFIFLIRFFPTLANVLVLIFFSRQLTTELYGHYQNFWVQVYVFSAIGGLGLQAFLVTYSGSFVATLIRKLSAPSWLIILGWIFANAAFFALLQQGGIMTSFWLPFFFLIVYIASVIVEVILSVFKKFALLLSVNFLYTIGFCLLHYSYLQGSFSLGQLFFLPFGVASWQVCCLWF